jgi:integrase
MDLFLDTVEAESSSHHPVYLTLGRAGIEIGEALALDGSNVDFNGKFLHIQNRYRGGRLGPARNGKPRTVDLQPVRR